MATTLRGKIVRIPPGKNFGFIELNGTQYFFHRQDFNGHWDDLIHDIAYDERTKIFVTFEEVASDKGPRATNVSRTDHPNQAV